MRYRERKTRGKREGGGRGDAMRDGDDEKRRKKRETTRP